MEFKEKYLKYKQKYVQLRNQIGYGQWDLFFQETDGRPYYENKITNEKVWAGNDQQINYQTIVTTIRKDPEGFVITKPRFNNEYDDDHDIYYVDRYDKITGENFELNIKNGNKRKFNFKKNANELWEIKSIDQIKYFKKDIEETEIENHKDPLDTSLLNINIELEEIQGEELEKFILNNNEQDGLYIYFPNAYLKLLSEKVHSDEKKIFTPNRFAIHGNYESFNIVPIYYINENQQIKSIYYDLINTELENNISRSEKLGFTDDDDKLKEEKKIHKIFNDKVMYSKGLWIALARFIVRVKIKDNTTYAIINRASSDYLVKGYGKVVTCFLIKYLLKEYPSEKLVLTLKSSGGSGKVWEGHGFVKKVDLDSGMIEKVDHLLDLSKSSSICNDVLKRFDIDKFLYYNSIKQIESEPSNKL